MRKSVITLVSIGLLAVGVSAAPATAAASADTGAASARKILPPGTVWDGKPCQNKGKVIRVGNRYESVLFKCKRGRHGGKLRWHYNGGERR